MNEGTEFEGIDFKAWANRVAQSNFEKLLELVGPVDAVGERILRRWAWDLSGDAVKELLASRKRQADIERSQRVRAQAQELLWAQEKQAAQRSGKPGGE